MLGWEIEWPGWVGPVGVVVFWICATFPFALGMLIWHRKRNEEKWYKWLELWTAMSGVLWLIIILIFLAIIAS